MITEVLWWVAQVGGLAAIGYVLLWAINFFGPPEPFGKLIKGAVAIAGAVVAIWMILRLFEVLGHPIAGQ